MYRHVLARWWDVCRAGLDHPMVDRRNSTRRQLNRLAHHEHQEMIWVDRISWFLASGCSGLNGGDTRTLAAGAASFPVAIWAAIHGGVPATAVPSPPCA